MIETERKNLLYQLDKRVEKGLVRKIKHKTLPLTIFTYTNECMFHGEWDKYTMMARGLILDDQGVQHGACMGKFFNYQERHAPEPPNLPFDIYEKIDGSMLSTFYYQGEWRMATRGSFDNEFIDYAMQFLDYYKHFPTQYTLISEICLPAELDGLTRVVQHSPGVYLLGGVDLYSGKDIHLSKLIEDWKGFLPKVYKGELESFIRLCQDKTDTEGWVVRYTNGFRFKLKTSWYVRLFRSVMRLDEKVRDSILHDVPFKEFLKDVPEELREDATATYNHLIHCVKQEEYRLLGKVLDNWKPTIADFARSIALDPDRGLMMLVYQERSIKQKCVENAPLPEKQLLLV